MVSFKLRPRSCRTSDPWVPEPVCCRQESNPSRPGHSHSSQCGATNCSDTMKAQYRNEILQNCHSNSKKDHCLRCSACKLVTFPYSDASSRQNVSGLTGKTVSAVTQNRTLFFALCVRSSKQPKTCVGLWKLNCTRLAFVSSPTQFPRPICVEQVFICIQRC